MKEKRKIPARLRVGMAGAGRITYNHLLAWRGLKNADVVAIADPLVERASGRSKEFDIPSVYDDVADMLDREDLDVLDIVSPKVRHAEHVRLAAEYNIDALCQKPLTDMLAKSEQLVNDVDGRVRLMVNENRRFRSDFRQIAVWLSEGRLGEILQCQMTMNRSGYLPDKSGRRPAIARAPGRAALTRLLILEVLIHQLDVLRYLTGPLNVIATRATRTVAELAGETLATIFMETSTGAPVVLAGNFVAPGFGVTVSDRFELIGSKASIVLEPGELKLLGPEACVLAYDMKKEYQTCFDTAIAHFTECIVTGKPFESDPHDNLETLRLVEAAYITSGLDTT
jgi:D-apiose dehydrogenase